MPTFTSSKSPVKAFMFSLSLSSFHFFFKALPFFLIKGKECSPISVSNIAWCNISMSLAISLSFYSIYVLYKDMERPKKKKSIYFIICKGEKWEIIKVLLNPHCHSKCSTILKLWKCQSTRLAHKACYAIILGSFTHRFLSIRKSVPKTKRLGPNPSNSQTTLQSHL